MFGSEVAMIFTKAQALRIIHGAYGAAMAESVARQLPERIDLDDAANAELLLRLGVTRDRLFDALGAEL
jgi:hypothetical protein